MGCSVVTVESKSEIGLRHPPSRQQRGGSWRQVTCHYLRVENERPQRTVGLLEAECPWTLFYSAQLLIHNFREVSRKK